MYQFDLTSLIDQKGKSFFAVRLQAKGSVEMMDSIIEDQNIMLEVERADLKRKLEEFEKLWIESKENHDKLAYLFEIGYIDKE